MTVPRNSSLSVEHRRHDQLLVARFAAGDVEGAQLHEAQELVRRCSECAALSADIKVISKSVGQMPTPARTRDFRLSAAEADKLRGGRFERFLRTLTGSSWSTVRPVAAVALSVGLVMSVVGAMPLLGAAGAAAPAPQDTVFFATQRPVSDVGNPTPESTDNAITGPNAAPGATPAPPESNPGGQNPAMSSDASSLINNVYVPTSAPERQGPGDAPVAQPSAAAAGSGKDLSTPLPGATLPTNSVILIAGVIVSVLALVALIALYAARRRYNDPLLR